MASVPVGGKEHIEARVFSGSQQVVVAEPIPPSVLRFRDRVPGNRADRRRIRRKSHRQSGARRRADGERSGADRNIAKCPERDDLGQHDRL